MAANYGVATSIDHFKNKLVKHEDRTIMLQAASIYTQGNGKGCTKEQMFEIMLEIAESSLQMLGWDLRNQMKG